MDWVGAVLVGEAEEEGTHDSRSEGVRIIEGSVLVGNEAQPPSKCLLGHCPDGVVPAQYSIQTSAPADAQYPGQAIYQDL